MKAFIRKLSIKERKGYTYSIIYSIFYGLHILITKIILYKLKIHYLTLLSLSGSLLILMSFYRIFRSIKKFQSLKEKDKLNQIDILQGICSFIVYGSLLASLNWTSLTNVVLISRLFTFIIMFNTFIKESESIPSYYLYCFLGYLFPFLMIFIPLLSKNQAPGIFCCLISVIFAFILSKYFSQAKGIRVDIIALNIGFYSSYLGGILMIILYNKMEHISKLLWVLIILNTFTAYCMNIFLHKLVKNKTNYQKLLILNLMTLTIVLPIDLFLFKENFSYNYYLLLILFLDIFFFYKKVIKSKENDLDNY